MPRNCYLNSKNYNFIQDFVKSYADCGHTLLKIRIGELITHDQEGVAA